MSNTKADLKQVKTNSLICMYADFDQEWYDLLINSLVFADTD